MQYKMSCHKNILFKKNKEKEFQITSTLWFVLVPYSLI